MSDDQNELIDKLQDVNDNKSERIEKHLELLADKDELMIKCSEELQYCLDMINSYDEDKAIGLIHDIINKLRGGQK